MMMFRTLLLKENHAGHTPLEFAALRGVYPVLRYLLHCEGVYKLTFSQLGLSSFCAYMYDVNDKGPNSGVAGRWKAAQRTGSAAVRES